MNNEKIVEQLRSVLRSMGTDYKLTTARNMVKNTINEIVRVEKKATKRKIVVEKEAKQKQEQKVNPITKPNLYAGYDPQKNLDRLEKMIQEEKSKLEQLQKPPVPDQPNQNLLG